MPPPARSTGAGDARRELLRRLTLHEDGGVARGPSELPLSTSQQRIWFQMQLDPSDPVFNVTALVAVRGDLDESALERAVTAIGDRHPLLRAGFPDRDGRPVQVIGDVPLRLSVHGERSEPVLDRAASLARLPFDLATGPAFRAHLLHGAVAHVLLVAHHIVCDGWSLNIVVRDLLAAYRGQLPARAAGGGAATPSFADYVEWERTWCTSDDAERQRRYWRSTFPPRVETTRATAAPAPAPTAGTSCSVHLLPPAQRALERAMRGCSATAFTILLGVLVRILSARARSDEIVVGAGFANRPRRAFEEVVGCFVNLLPLRVRSGGHATMRDLIAHCAAVAASALANGSLPYGAILEEIGGHRSRTPQEAPLMEVVLVHQNAPSAALDATGVGLEPVDLDIGIARFPATVFLRTVAGRSVITLQWSDGSRTDPDARALLFDLVEGIARCDEELDRPIPEAPAARRAPPPPPGSAAASFRAFLGRATRDEPTPVLIAPPKAGRCADWIHANRSDLARQISEGGALLLRGFRMDPTEFRAAAHAWSPALRLVNGEHEAVDALDGVFHPTRFRSDRKLLWHNEDTFNRNWPRWVMFCCISPADAGGDTPLVDAGAVFEGIDAPVRREFLRRGVMYVRRYGGGLGRSWQEVYGTDSRTDVERRCRAEGVVASWGPDGVLRTSAVRPAATRHPETGRWCWTNQAQHWHPSAIGGYVGASLDEVLAADELPRDCRYGDGGPIPHEVMLHILDVYRRLERRFPWHAGDLLVIDNVATAHGRAAFQGERRHLAAFAGSVVADHGAAHYEATGSP